MTLCNEDRARDALNNCVGAMQSMRHQLEAVRRLFEGTAREASVVEALEAADSAMCIAETEACSLLQEL